MAERVLQSTPVAVSQGWYQDGVLTDPGVVTATVTRDDGTVLLTNAATTGTGAAVRVLDLTIAQTALLDILTVTWTSATKGTLTSRVEIVGGFMFSIADARALKPLDSTTKYPAAAIAQARTLAEQALEKECNVAFVPTYARERQSGRTPMVLNHLRVRTIRSVKTTTGGVSTALTSAELVNLAPHGSNILHNPLGWFSGYSNVEIIYEHGHDYPPARGSHAALVLAKSYLVDGPADERATSYTTTDGSYSLLLAGTRGSVFNLPEVEAFVQQYRESIPFA